jgi:GT2 family glycosyltransferase
MKLTIVVVLFKQVVEASKTFRTLQQAMLHLKRDLPEPIKVILYDNSPEKQSFESNNDKEVSISYVHDPRNLGIATAYNYALAAARENGSEWLMLLDHDTEITSEYIEAVMIGDEQDNSIAAIVPKIKSENQMISPVYSHTLRPLQGEKPVAGIQEKPVMAINSGALVRVDFLTKMGGLNEEFPLDYLDHWLFHVIYDQGYKVRLLDVTLEHELSVMDYSRVSLKRYQSILESEIHFFKNYQQDLYKAYRIQLAKRFLKQVLTVKNKKIALYTLRRFFSM